jgi:hypothetical protein
MALHTMASGGSVLVYCAQGRHRSVAMAAAILIATGYTVPEAMYLLCTRRRAADPKAPHIDRRIRAFEKYWRRESSQPDGFLDRMIEAYSEFTTTLAANLVFLFMKLGRKDSNIPNVTPD